MTAEQWSSLLSPVTVGAILSLIGVIEGIIIIIIDRRKK
jgi:hypothetical protein